MRKAALKSTERHTTEHKAEGIQVFRTNDKLEQTAFFIGWLLLDASDSNGPYRQIYKSGS